MLQMNYLELASDMGLLRQEIMEHGNELDVYEEPTAHPETRRPTRAKEGLTDIGIQAEYGFVISCLKLPRTCCLHSLCLVVLCARLSVSDEHGSFWDGRVPCPSDEKLGFIGFE